MGKATKENMKLQKGDVKSKRKRRLNLRKRGIQKDVRYQE